MESNAPDAAKNLFRSSATATAAASVGWRGSDEVVDSVETDRRTRRSRRTRSVQLFHVNLDCRRWTVHPAVSHRIFELYNASICAVGLFRY